MFANILMYAQIVISALPHIHNQILLKIRSRIHYYTYKAVPEPLNIVVIGGSFGGLTLALELANTIPTGYRVVLVEKRSHFGYTWVFPRVSVVEGHEHKAFIPYGPILQSLPQGALILKQGVVVEVSEKRIILQDGTVFDFEYLAIATGSTGFAPWHQSLENKTQGMETFQTMQNSIREATHLVVIGGGAVGVEIASDAKSKYPEKQVTLIHSRDTLLNTFGKRLHDHAMQVFAQLGVNVYLGERVLVEDGSTSLVLKSGKEVPFDLLLQCTGQRPASNILATLSSSSISPSGTILVQKTLQILDPEHPNIYALGDVAKTGGVKMGRAAALQASVVAQNIRNMIFGKALKDYQSIPALDSAIDLTLGLTSGAVYFRHGDKEILLERKKDIDLEAGKLWKLLGAKPFEDEAYVPHCVLRSL
ncbi:hypothetical protein BP6252_12514 [Coleophoma cylindrospora]|uniref:FAD/NAD(P)-binding domain-containing protein n=1 Tax=Coleophoma cylindrospora TaxID=1849047 RepID=A0A3D8QCI8_9HELO|nr:hypothetical protein BP6252_12514 [Coleophoma cylindrospora]